MLVCLTNTRAKMFYWYLVLVALECYAVHVYITLQCTVLSAKTGMYDWLTVGSHQRDGLRSVTMTYGGQFVTTAGEMSMPRLFVVS